MPQPTAILGAQIFDGTDFLTGTGLVVHTNGAVECAAETEVAALPAITLGGGIIMPGFVDLQVNGGGGVMFNDAPEVATLDRMAKAHARDGTAALLPTLITDTAGKTQAAIEAAVAALDQKTKGIMGLHLEGPHLDVTRKGAHDANLIRPMEDTDLAMLLDANDRLPNLMVTVAPENVTFKQIKTLAQAGVFVSLGHSDCTYDTAMRAFEAGARGVTHLFNAMSQMGGRTPGLVGAALSSGVAAGVIADGIHVHPATLRSALLAKTSGAFLVTDAMAVAGTNLTRFELEGREITRTQGRLTLSDGTLAGADLTFARAIQILTRDVGIPQSRALAMATRIPASMLREAQGAGHLPETVGGLIHVDVDAGIAQPLSVGMDLGRKL